jgi:glutamate-ammonia-ligase adenylyltransferase
VLGNAPRLADILALHPHVMDGLIEPSFFGALPDAEKLAAELSGSLAQATSYEDLLDRARQFGQEHMFLIGARILSGTVSAEQAGEAFARLADVLIRAVHTAVQENFIRAYGRIKDQQSVVLALESSAAAR